ncbi:TNF receptor-associated factor 3-like isoform X2 [Dendronephthya gigantea]|uniref:TNF receptor-associated factor 3-like isoform X2 n=1 Tax=Dendronephthya gigantea TaxID=151771 RepID=UPI0010692553|nr:TNF receptor-associated factor 3-like isoform X2 [Dendronephthya gigantea]
MIEGHSFSDKGNIFAIMPGIKITNEDRNKINPKFFCTSCNLLLSIPTQTICGHLMCSSCINTLLTSPDPRCPKDGTVLRKEDIFQDKFTGRELGALKLHCPNAGCRWCGVYIEIENHFQVCGYAMIKCVNSQCQMEFQRLQLDEHLKNECEYRKVICNYCPQNVSLASLQDHISTSCDGAPVTCKFCKTEVVRRDIERHEQVVCEEVPGECEFHHVGCNHDKTVKRREMRRHMHDSVIDHVRLLLHFVLNFVSQLSSYIPRPEFTGIIQKVRNDISEVRSGLAENFVTVVGKLTGLERRIEDLESNRGGNTRMRDELVEFRSKIEQLKTEINVLREQNRTSERQLRERELQLERMRSRMDQIDESLALNTVKIADLETQKGPRAQQSIHSYNGTLLWKIEDYQKKRQDAINGVKTSLYSQPFYSAQYGYKMCAKIYMNGDGFGKGSHLSLFFVVMKVVTSTTKLHCWKYLFEWQHPE